MSYTLSFLQRLNLDNSHIIYDPKEFDEKPITISVPELVEIFKQFIKTFEKFGIVETNSIRSIQDKKAAKTDDTLNSDKQESNQVTSGTGTILKVLSGEAFVRQSKEVDKTALDELCVDLTKYLHSCCLKLNSENFLSDESVLYFSGLREVTELRNYLAKYTKSKKNVFQNGYLYVMNI